MAELPAAVTVVTARDASGAPMGATVSAVSSLSLDPPLLLVCLATASDTCQALEAGSPFLVHLLRDGQEETALRFAARATKFAGAGWRRAGAGCRGWTVRARACLRGAQPPAGRRPRHRRRRRARGRARRRRSAGVPPTALPRRAGRRLAPFRVPRRLRAGGGGGGADRTRPPPASDHRQRARATALQAAPAASPGSPVNWPGDPLRLRRGQIADASTENARLAWLRPHRVAARARREPRLAAIRPGAARPELPIADAVDGP